MFCLFSELRAILFITRREVCYSISREISSRQSAKQSPDQREVISLALGGREGGEGRLLEMISPHSRLFVTI